MRNLFLAAATFLSGLIFAMPKIASGKHQIAQSGASGSAVNDLVRDERVKFAMDWVTKNVSWITDEQVRITEIAAPPFKEAERAAYMKKALAAIGLRVQTDEVGNVIGELTGTSENDRSFLEKPASMAIMKGLKKGLTIREISKVAEVSTKTVMKVKALVS